MTINYENMGKLEEKVEKMIEDYGAPEHISDNIKDFLLESMYLHSIVEVAISTGTVTVEKH